jgi:hypothetical protein
MVSFSGFFVNAIAYGYIGASCVAPFYAGLTAVLRRALYDAELGPLNSVLYKLASTGFNDITKGNNDSNDTPANVAIAIPGYTGTTPDAPFFTAGKGWDACTGLGSIDGTKLLNGIAGLIEKKESALVDPNNPFSFVYPASITQNYWPRLPSTGFAVCPGGFPLQECIREPIVSAVRSVPQTPPNPVAAEPLPWSSRAASDRPTPHATPWQSD